MFLKINIINMIDMEIAIKKIVLSKIQSIEYEYRIVLTMTMKTIMKNMRNFHFK